MRAVRAPVLCFGVAGNESGDGVLCAPRPHPRGESHARMVPPGRSLFLLLFTLVSQSIVACTADFPATEQLSFGGMPLASAESPFSASSDSSEPWPAYPSENPSTDESRNWTDAWRASIRAGGYESIAADNPVRPSELRHKAALVTRIEHPPILRPAAQKDARSGNCPGSRCSCAPSSSRSGPGQHGMSTPAGVRERESRRRALRVYDPSAC